MQRFYFPELNTDGETLIITNKVLLHQLHRVLRMKLGTQIILFDTKDNRDYIYEVTFLDEKKLSLKKIGHHQKYADIQFELNIIQALPNKTEKIEYIIQKGTEIGVTGFVFFRSKRSQKISLSENKIERFKKIIIEATEQSGRNFIPSLFFYTAFPLDIFQKNENIVLHNILKNDAQTLKTISLNYQKGINVLVGPEGGFCENEFVTFDEAGFQKLYLGNRILRTETAGIVASFFLIQNQ